VVVICMEWWVVGEVRLHTR